MVKIIIPDNDFDTKILQVWKTVHNWGWSKFIPLSECFEKFNVPDMSKLEERINNNFIYFRTNYMALYVLLLLIAGFSAPIFSVVDFCLCVLWILPFVWVPTPFSLGDFRITPSCVVAGLSIFSMLVFVMFRRYLLHFIGFNLLFLILMGLHLVFRNSSLMSRLHVGLNEKNKLKKFYECSVCFYIFTDIMKFVSE